MKTFGCACGATLFFDNTQCTNCGRWTGWCPHCQGVRGLDSAGELWRCTACGGELDACENYAGHYSCNRMVPAGAGPQCSYCALNEVIPNLEVPGNADRWARLEAAKRRLLYTLDRLALPYGPETDPPLRFSFMGDGEMAGLWRSAGAQERVLTGHAGGLVTINIREADDAEREKLRVDMGEAHRTLIGHFRHEIGHYYWDLLVRGRDEAGFAAVFGDPASPSYAEALERHYAEGPPAGWKRSHVSAYATMHPWEDWAESFAFWLDMVSVLDTARDLNLLAGPVPDDTEAMLDRYRTLGLVLNELNREMGLLDFVPEVITGAIAGKLGYVHRVVRAGATGPAAIFA